MRSSACAMVTWSNGTPRIDTGQAVAGSAGSGAPERGARRLGASARNGTEAEFISAIVRPIDIPRHGDCPFPLDDLRSNPHRLWGHDPLQGNRAVFYTAPRWS